MKTREEPNIKAALDSADRSVGDMLRASLAFFFLLRALVLAVCAIADGINQIVADMPSHDN